MKIILWSLVIIFPIAGASRLFAPTQEFYNWAARPEWVHVLAHLTLYSIFGILWQRFSPHPVPFWQYLLIVFTLGIFQEAFQNLTSANGPQTVNQVVFDWGVDLVAGSLGWWLGAHFLPPSAGKEPNS